MQLSDEEKCLFRQAVQGTKILTQNTLEPQSKYRNRLKQNTFLKIENEKRQLREQNDTLFYFSDEYEPLLDEEKVKYLRSGEDKHLLKQLRRGDFIPELFLDLHGLTREQAKQELAALILACEKENIICACVMTGYGTYTLKRQIPRWLVQHPKIIAIHQAPKEWGSDAAILILVETIK
ncbi:endonuclease SmrB [Mergibacter septicus]|uniref:endonuclease SmrB n=1 Tax=Mergibacter septicus TaxID=221402 RepID=UPI0011793AF1|nr:endonuclease SmrB [Mergibacter septicus]AWX14452.1 endonuclease SmrB [Mergibacter septicus]